MLADVVPGLKNTLPCEFSHQNVEGAMYCSECSPNGPYDCTWCMCGLWLEPKVKIIEGDLLKLREFDAIAHQVNCLTVKPHGFSKQVADKYPWGDIYSKRIPEGKRNLAVKSDRGVPGTIQIFKSTTVNSPAIVCLLSQWDFGSTGQSRRCIPPYKDTAENRLMWFGQCFDHIKDVKILGLPYKIGCGLAGGDCSLYFKMICAYARKSSVQIIVVKLK